jgi:glycine/D-amino acid oxidase-like deaminating enzyme
VRLALGELAKLHAGYWGDRLDGHPWLLAAKGGPRMLPSGLAERNWPGFRQRYGERISPDALRVGERFVRRFDQYANGYRGPRCLTHNDFRADNMMFGTAAGGRPITILDWGSIGRECPMADVAFFLAGSLSPDDRRAHERDLLEGYHRRLVELGVADYGFDRLWRDYGRYGFALFYTAFSAPMIVVQTARGDEMFLKMFDRALRHVLDHDAMAILEAEIDADKLR